ncbi:DUF1488 family protein [Piscinibacter gummiphilus]|uniref:DUF1488 family protein n=1 Tax=Piscinibacter gummiphilus TaxID=946333 RepID=A0ABZ0D0E3_9BURK|nr:DUF1488 family protein [Piscinibacter gummiphilus]WOB10717.1 DUF1488 family protein [Piscinibacter gummiphilus]
MSRDAFFHEESRAVRFYVSIEGEFVGASIGQLTLHYCFRPNGREEDPIETFRAHADEIEAAVRRRVENGAYKPVLLRESDLRHAKGPD